MDFLLKTFGSRKQTEEKKERDGKKLRKKWFLAAETGNLNKLKTIASKEVIDLDEKEDGRSALYLCAKNGHTECISFLAFMGADVEAQRDNGCSPVYAAAQENHSDAIYLLHSLGANVHLSAENNCKPLYRASELGRIDALDALLDLGGKKDINEKYNQGFFPLYAAAYNGHSNIVKRLVDWDANVNATSLKGHSAFFVVTYKGSVEISEYLLQNGADINMVDDDGNTFIQIALSAKHLDIVKLLYDHGIDINITNNSNLTCMEYALASNNFESVKFLWECGASMETHDGSLTMVDRLQDYPDTSEKIQNFFKIFRRLKETQWSRVIIQEEFYLRAFFYSILRIPKSISCGWIFFHQAHEWNNFPKVEYKSKNEIDDWINKNMYLGHSYSQ